MKQWIIRHLPVWVLRLLKKQDWACLALYCRHDHRLDFGCNCDPLEGEGCEECKPVGVPEWMAEAVKPYDSITYKGNPFYYQPCFCDNNAGENCEACRPKGK